LLTVIAIIGILAAILIPVVGRAREQARRAACVVNLRELHRAVVMFAQDQHAGRIPDMARPFSTILYHVGKTQLEALMQDYGITEDSLYCPSNPTWNGRRHEFWDSGSAWAREERTPIGYVIIAGSESARSDSPRNDYPRSLEQETHRTEFAADLMVRSGGSFEGRINHVPGETVGVNVIHIHGNVEWRPFEKLFPGTNQQWQPYW
jgi:type II secretory pathway pseudopilin PulG